MSDHVSGKPKPDYTPATDSLQALIQLNRQLLGTVVLFICIGSIILSIVSTQLSTADNTWIEWWGHGALVFLASFLVNLAAASAIYLASLRWVIPKIKEIESKQSAQILIVDPLYNRISAKLDEMKMSDVKEYPSQFDLTPDFDKD